MRISSDPRKVRMPHFPASQTALKDFIKNNTVFSRNCWAVNVTTPVHNEPRAYRNTPVAPIDILGLAEGAAFLAAGARFVVVVCRVVLLLFGADDVALGAATAAAGVGHATSPFRIIARNRLFVGDGSSHCTDASWLKYSSTDPRDPRPQAPSTPER